MADKSVGKDSKKCVPPSLGNSVVIGEPIPKGYTAVGTSIGEIPVSLVGITKPPPAYKKMFFPPSMDDLPTHVSPYVSGPEPFNDNPDDDDDDSLADEQADGLPESMNSFADKMGTQSIGDILFGTSLKKYMKKTIEMTTDGLSHDDAKYYVYNQKNSSAGIKRCNMCNKYFPEMIITDEFDGDPTCWHCLFFINSNNADTIKDIYGISLESYVQLCSPAHKIEQCVRPDSCVLCLSNNNVPTSVKSNDPNKIDRFIDNINNDVVDKQLDDEIEFGVMI